MTKDKYRQKFYTQVGIGGPQCPCCNTFHGKSNKSKLNRIARAKLKAELHIITKRLD